MNRTSTPHPFRNIGITAKTGDSRIKQTLTDLVNCLRKHELNIHVDDYCASILRDLPEAVGLNSLGPVCDLLIAIGGDGTMLYAAQTASSYNAPLLGINLGRIGFLSDIVPEEMEERLDEVFSGHYSEEKRFQLHCVVERQGQIIKEYTAFNDIVIQKWNIARLIEIKTAIDGQFVHSQRSDGMIIATPTGSTAYSLSGGGPILHPSLHAMVLVPICPHTLTNRPIVIDSACKIELEVGGKFPGHARVTCDGELKIELHPGDRIIVQKNEQLIRLLHPAVHDHYAVLRSKMNWGLG